MGVLRMLKHGAYIVVIVKCKEAHQLSLAMS